ncbi:MAG: hypothetical protein IJ820_03520, partial [Lachnospiraceae bacterium]|nr:hypothetical protein [Lachnospiraceae bacterium]
MENMDQIEKDLQEAREYVPNITRVFLENGDPFCLSADRLSAIAVRIHEYLTKVDTIAMYASIKNIRGKSDKELKQLRALDFPFDEALYKLELLSQYAIHSIEQPIRQGQWAYMAELCR